MAIDPVEEIAKAAGKRVANGVFLIHRNNGPNAMRMLNEGFRAGARGEHLSTVFTAHGELDREFVRALADRYRNSTHHMVFHIPPRAFALLRKLSGERIQLEDAANILVNSLGEKRVPPEWIVGHYTPQGGQFTNHPGYNPKHIPDFPQMREALERYRKERKTDGRPRNVEVPQPNAAAKNAPDVW